MPPLSCSSCFWLQGRRAGQPILLISQHAASLLHTTPPQPTQHAALLPHSSESSAFPQTPCWAFECLLLLTLSFSCCLVEMIWRSGRCQLIGESICCKRRWLKLFTKGIQLIWKFAIKNVQAGTQRGTERGQRGAHAQIALCFRRRPAVPPPRGGSRRAHPHQTRGAHSARAGSTLCLTHEHPRAPQRGVHRIDPACEQPRLWLCQGQGVQGGVGGGEGAQGERDEGVPDGGVQVLGGWVFWGVGRWGLWGWVVVRVVRWWGLWGCGVVGLWGGEGWGAVRVGVVGCVVQGQLGVCWARCLLPAPFPGPPSSYPPATQPSAYAPTLADRYLADPPGSYPPLLSVLQLLKAQPQLPRLIRRAVILQGLDAISSDMESMSGEGQWVGFFLFFSKSSEKRRRTQPAASSNSVRSAGPLLGGSTSSGAGSRNTPWRRQSTQAPPTTPNTPTPPTPQHPHPPTPPTPNTPTHKPTWCAPGAGGCTSPHRSKKGVFFFRTSKSNRGMSSPDGVWGIGLDWMRV